ncbi:Hypothetical protein CINCED_3A001487 [Cinara cedri]|uniref:Uncharacterized protein n=1 Tax=Cinara cedri TaxID=506608 RepID=A0A5E4MPW3_9HEMI|nr:Hypothetical protein CINCED_3A001487 [Cinara cedri]
MDKNNLFNRQPGCSKQSQLYAQREQRTSVPLSVSSTSKTDDGNKDNNHSNIAVINEGKKLLVGSVDQVVHWSQMLSFLEKTKILYQVYGFMDSIMTGSRKCEKIFCLRNEQKISRIVCVFYEIDRKMPEVPKGTFVLCTGHIKGKNKLQIFTIRELPEDNKNSFSRISLACQWAINDILIYSRV